MVPLFGHASSIWEGYSRAHDFAFSSASSSFARTNICIVPAPSEHGNIVKPHCRVPNQMLAGKKRQPAVCMVTNQSKCYPVPPFVLWFGAAKWSKYVNIDAILHRRVIESHLVDPLPPPLFFFLCFLGLPAVGGRTKESQRDYITWRKRAPPRG
jgi:hypothetical protein